jgi:hypothetical protein
VISQLELPRKWSGTGLTEITKNIGNMYQTYTGKGTYTRALCQKNEGSVKTKQKPVKMDGRNIYRTLSPKSATFQIGID